MSDVKKCIKSRFEGGYIMEADFSQLEVVGAAALTGDPMMKKDILDGIDSHSQSASWLHPEHTYEEIRAGYLAEDEYFTKLRKKSKAPRFELQYGAGAESIAENNGLSKAQAQGFIDQYYGRYSVLKEFQDMVIEEVKKSRRPSSHRTELGMPAGIGHYTNPTGRIFTFREFDAPDFLRKRGQRTSFSPTQCKNYPVQSFATGDIVPLMLGHIYKLLMTDEKLRGKCLLIGTVHDSVVFDVHPDVLDYAARTIKTLMERTPEFVERYLCVPFDMPLHCDIDIGEGAWYDMHSYKID